MSGLVRSGRSPWLATPLIAVATLCSLWALTSMVSLGAWAGTTAFALACVTIVVVVTRISSRSRSLPTIVGLVSVVLVLIPLYARDENGGTFALPTPGGITALVDILEAGVDYAARTPNPPVAVPPALGALITASLLGIFLITELIAVSGKAVASAGLVLLLPWIPAVFLGHRVSATVLIIELAAWIGAMTLARRNAPVERGVSLGSGLSATIATVGLIGLAAPAALGGLGWGSLPRFDTPDIFEGPTRLNLELDLRTSLTTNSSSPVLIYITSGARPDEFRVHTLTDFDGTQWSYDSPPVTNRSASTGLLWPEDVPGWVSSERVRVDVNILSLIDRSLPLPTSPRTVEVAGDWTYDPELDVVIADTETTKNLQYAFYVDLKYHSAASLRASDALLTQNPDLDEVDRAYLDIAPSIDLNAVSALATDLTADKVTRYDKALAIQNYLRNPAVFTYTTDVDPAPGDAVSSFLESKQGYCVQFATTMVVMLRSMGIPARLGLGFLNGSYDGSTGYIVRGADAHAWPEVFFPGHGWVRFEPTPSIQAGAPPSWADPYGSQIPVPRDVLEGGGYPTIPNTDGPGVPVDPTSAADRPSGMPWWLIAIVVVGTLGLASGALLWWRRRVVVTRRWLQGPEGSWQRLADGLGELAWPSSATVAEARTHVLHGLHRLAGGPPGNGGTALTALSEAVSDHRYAPSGTGVPQAQLDAWVQDVVTEAEAVMAEATSRPARGGARTAPQAGP